MFKFNINNYLYIFFFLSVLTQEEWNEKQRAERKSEFSWKYDGSSLSKTTSSYSPDDSQNDDDDEDMVGPSLDMFLTPNNPNKQTTIKSCKQPIHNELKDEPSAATSNKSFHDDDDDLDNIPLPSEPKKGAEIAPPPTYEYYGPSGRGLRVQENFVSTNEMQDSISKGFENVENVKNKPRQVRGIIDDD